MLIARRRCAKIAEEVHQGIMSQRSLGVYAYFLGTFSGILLTILVIKYAQFDDLLQQTTRPIFDLAQHPTFATIDLHSEVRILCWVLTYPKNHLTKAAAVKDTWGKRCNKLVFISTSPDENLDILLVNVTEDRRHLWGKTMKGLQQIYEQFGNEYDWFLKADDDTYVFMENLRHFLYAYSPEMPIYFGCKLKPYVDQGYMSGSAYVLSHEAVKRFNEGALSDDYNKCWNGTEGNEDVEMGKCLSSVGVLAGDSRDDLKRSRFLPFPPDGLIRNLFGYNWLDNATFYEIKKGYECCSSSVISFHYITDRQMYTFDYLLHHIQLASNKDRLPTKLSFDEVRERLIETPSTISSDGEEIVIN